MEALKYLYEFRLNWAISAICLVSSVSLSIFGLAEIGGVHFLKYSKFWKNNGKKMKLSSRNGMLIAYTPAFLAGFASFFVFPDDDQGLRFLLLRSTLTLHFFKRIFEVMWIHKYSGGMDVDTAVTIGSCYGIASGTMIYSQYLVQGYGEPEVDLSNLGIVLFLVGISGNFYHHYLLSKLRSKEDKQYKIPKGGLFGLVICPHYTFEIIEFWGIAFISQTLYSFAFPIGSSFYLIGRSYATRRWYLSKFEDFPSNVKAVIPFVF